MNKRMNEKNLNSFKLFQRGRMKEKRMKEIIYLNDLNSPTLSSIHSKNQMKKSLIQIIGNL